MKVNLESLIQQYLDDWFEYMPDEEILAYAREMLYENIREFSESEIINSIDEFYTYAKPKTK